MSYKDKIEKVLALRDQGMAEVHKKNYGTDTEALKKLYRSPEDAKVEIVKPKEVPPVTRTQARAYTYVPPSGSLDADFCIVGEQPGSREVKARPRKPFIGPAGKMLTNECMLSIGISRDQCYFTNVIKDLDHPLAYYISRPNYRKPVVVTEAGVKYLDILAEELSHSTAKIFVAVGNVALFALCDLWGITKWRGSVLDSTRLSGRLVVPIIHPATVIPPKNQYLNKLLIQYNLQRAKKIVENGWHPTPRELITSPSFEDAMMHLEATRKAGLNGTTIDFDIELDPKTSELTCFSTAYKQDSAMSIPVIHAGGDYFSVEKEVEIFIVLSGILEDERIKKRGQNLGFDSHFMLRRYGIKMHNVDDTMVAQRIIMPDYPIGLDFITSIWTDHKYYKDEGKKYFSGGNWQRLWEYNNTDTLMCQTAFPKQLKTLEQQGNVETYNRQRDIIEPLVYMQERGIKVDMDVMLSLRKGIQTEVDTKQEELNQATGRDLNPNSDLQVSEYFYGAAGKNLEPYKSKKTKSGTTVDKTAMKRLVRRGFPEAKLISDLRGLTKRISTYLEPTKVDKDGRIRCSYNPVGTKFSRISSSENIFGTGMNMQNWPHELLKCLLIDEGYIGYFPDLSQAENRIVAYVGNITPMIEAFENNKDVHSLTGSLISGLPYDEVRRQDALGICCDIGLGDQTWRFWGKKSNHAFNYDEGHVTFSLDVEIPESDGKYILNKYHLVYPGVRQNYHKMVIKQLRENRTITNLMGRKTLFTDKWEDKLFKVGYSCIPQGTVGDVINERGLNYIYYNQSEFRPVELLTQTHDQIGFQIPLSIPLVEHARMIRLIKKELEISLTAPNGIEFVIPVDYTIGFSFHKKSGTEIKGRDFPASDEELAKKLEGIVIKKLIKDYSLCLGR